ncbi:protein kinase domain-containing protein [Paraliomyxa miuraensis]|uniref:protein kinase domain-containing protein n=1 Tax=Paraliomyxa miuraensis TaxID=376150 RepID=UPI0022542A4E|nr:protein kinase [Paraliomyxa miuraensis]MCX4241055.1 protein kinase [Paraliomyxa miuraensis]
MHRTEVEDATRSLASTVEDGTELLASKPLPGAAHHSDLPTLTQLGRFVLLRHVGSGGMGEVYAAYDEQLDRRVAIKLLRADASHRTRARERLLREAQGLARLSHPNVVQVHEVGVHDDLVFIVMEFVEGLTVRDWLLEPGDPATAPPRSEPESARPTKDAKRAPRRRSIQAVLDVFVEAGRGLAAAHAMGLIHRDFKPGNVMVGEDGRVRVLDFGLVQRDDEPEPPPGLDDDEPDASSQTLDPGTRTGLFLGTPAYMAPEQFAGTELDARTDQFSFCVALHEALYGLRPFEGRGLATLIVNVRRGQMRPLPPDHDVPAWLRAVVLRGLSIDPADRFESMDALLHALTHDPAVVWRRWLRTIASLAAVALVVALVILGGLELRDRWREEQRQTAAAQALERLEERIARLRAEGDLARARRLFEDFVARPELQDTDALAQAWLLEAERRRADDAFEDAQSAYARAYLRARSGTIEAEALVGLAQGFDQRLDWTALHQVLHMLQQHHPALLEDPALREIRLRAALQARDLAAAQRLLQTAGDPEDLRLHALQALQGATPTPYRDIAAAWPFELEDDGTRQLLLRDERGGALRVVEADPTLAERVVVSIGEGTGYPVPPGHERPGLFVAERGEEVALLRLGSDGTATELLRWTEGRPEGVTAGDLDGDGEPEIYVGTSPQSRRIVRLDRDAAGQWSWTAPERHAEASLSDTMAVELADLDGDGRPELVAGTSDWTAYDVRVLAAEGKELRLIARDQLGPILDVKVVKDAAAQALIVVNKTGGRGNTTIFPPDRPSGEPVGLHVLRLVDDHLERVALVPPPHASPTYGPARLFGLMVGDVDGNGLDDVVVVVDRLDGAHTWLQLQAPDGSFTPLLLGNVRARAAVELDGDPASELLVEIEDDQDVGHLWILGTGTQALPLHGLANEAPEPAPRGEFAAELAASWERAGELEGMGLFAEAALAFEDLAIASADPAIGSAARLRAAALRERSGDDHAALEHYDRVRAEGDPARSIEALRGALRLRAREGAYAPVVELANALLARPEVDEPERSSLVALRDELADVVHGLARLELPLDRPLPPSLRIHQPLNLHRDPSTASLEVSGFLEGELASIPVTWSGGHLALEVEWSIPRAEWGAGLAWVLIPEAGGDPVLRLQERAEGGANEVSLELRCSIAPDVGVTRVDDADPGLLERNVMRAVLTPALHERRVSIFDAQGKRVADQRSHVAFEAPPQGDYRLVLRAYDEWGSDGWNEVRIHRITATGLRMRGPPSEPATAVEAAGRAFVEGDLRAAVERLAALPQPSADAQAMHAHALMMLGRVHEGQAILDPLIGTLGPGTDGDPDPGDGERALATLLRRHPVLYAPLLRERMGARFSALAHQAWMLALLFHADEPVVQRELLELLDDLDASPEAVDPLAASRLISLRLKRADVLIELHEPDAARRELASVLALGEALPPRRQKAVQMELELRHAALEVDAGELPRARERVLRVLEASARRMYMEEQLRVDPRLSRVLDPPAPR